MKKLKKDKNKNVKKGFDNHDSDCATHNEPAYKNGMCDCRLSNKNGEKQ